MIQYDPIWFKWVWCNQAVKILKIQRLLTSIDLYKYRIAEVLRMAFLNARSFHDSGESCFPTELHAT